MPAVIVFTGGVVEVVLCTVEVVVQFRLSKLWWLSIVKVVSGSVTADVNLTFVGSPSNDRIWTTTNMKAVPHFA